MNAAATVTVPATSANLGPGFDSFGLALGLANRFTARLVEDGAWSVEIRGEGADSLSRGAGNRVALAMARVFAEAGAPDLGAYVACENEIPPGEGLGSSAAAIVGGMLLADHLTGAGLGPERLLELAGSMEGHPDNVAAALLGGFTVAWGGAEAARALRVEPACGVAAVVVRAGRALSTPSSRALLPSSVPHADAAFSAGRAGALAAGLAVGDPDAVAAGLVDRIHERFRASAIPDLAEIEAALLEAGATGAVLSGAGPTVLGLVCAADDSAALERARLVAEAIGPRLEAMPGRRAPLVLAVDRAGARVG